MARLFIAEKPSVGRAIADIFGIASKEKSHIDDVSVVRLTNPAAFSMTTKEIFHYSDEEGNKEARITISPYYKERNFFWQYFAKQGGHGIL